MDIVQHQDPATSSATPQEVQPQPPSQSPAMLSGIFYRHGRLCASHPWEVIVAFLTLTVCMISMGTMVTGSKICAWNPNCVLTQENKGIDVVVMTIMRCMALLYVYHQFRKLYKLGSKYLLGIAGLFTVFSSVVFSSSVINLLDGNFTELNEALPFFLLLIDLSKAGLLAQFALSSGTQAQVRENIARGMALLGPSITLDTLVETLVIGVGTLSGVKHLEEMCCFACMSALVNYIVFMTFFPACLSLILELSRDHSQSGGSSAWQAQLSRVLHLEQQQKANPVLQRVKVIMSAGLMAVHAHSRWPLLAPPGVPPVDGDPLLHRGGPDVPQSVFLSSSISPWTQTILRWFAVGTDQIVMLVLACALAVKYIFFESDQELREQLAATSPSIQGSSLDVSTLTASGTTGAASGLGSGVLQRMQHSQTSPDLGHHMACCARARFVLGGDSEDSRELCSKASQTESMLQASSEDEDLTDDSSSSRASSPRPATQCLDILNSQEEGAGPDNLSDEEVMLLVEGGHLPSYQLEGILGDPQRGVSIRRTLLWRSLCQVSEEPDPSSDVLLKLPYRNYDYSLVLGACCENVIGYMPVPVGVAGPLLLDGEKYHVPMATTEGCLVASTNRGCRALALSGGARSSVVADGMTRGPVVRMPTAQEAAMVMCWLQQRENFELLKSSFDSTSRFARLQNLQVRIAGRLLFIRFVSITGDAMGMNMLSKGTEVSLTRLQEVFPALEIVSLSGNFCTDKKPAAINWLEGRGKSVVCEAQIPADVVQRVLKTSVADLIDVNMSKNLIGSAVAGSVGGFNAQAANIVTAIYIATGQDPAQNVGSSNCMTLVEACGESGENLYISCTMPSIEIGTVGGGTMLPAQAACLELLGVRGPCLERPGENASRLARVVCGTVLAGELSLLSALAAGHLVKSHMKHNRSQAAINSGPGSMTN